MTCGTLEENLANNRIMARALAAQGYDVTLREVRDVHNYIGVARRVRPAPDRAAREVTRAVSGTPTPSSTTPPSGCDGQVVALRALGPPGARVPLRGAAAPGTSRTTAWSTRSGGCSTPAG